jgi:hypothetical protein
MRVVNYKSEELIHELMKKYRTSMLNELDNILTELQNLKIPEKTAYPLLINSFSLIISDFCLSLLGNKENAISMLSDIHEFCCRQIAETHKDIQHDKS